MSETKKVKTLRTALDNLPYGDKNTDVRTFIRHSSHLPEGVTTGMIRRDVIAITWPSFVELILTQLTGMADQIMVGRMPGQEGVMGLSAVGIATQPKFMLMTIMMALNVGATAVIARFRGQQDRERVNRVFQQSLILNALLGLFFMIVGVIFAPQLLRFFAGSGLSDATFERAVSYLTIQFYGFVPMVLTFTITAALRGVGDSRTPLIYNTTANVVNLIFNYMMIYGHFGFPAMGIIGASLATIIGQTVAFIMAFIHIYGDKHYVYFSFRERVHYDHVLMKNVINIGIPSMIEQLFMRGGMIIFTRTLTSLGDILYATHNVCMSIQSISFMMGQAFANATTTLTGQSLGKWRLDMSVKYARETEKLGVLASAIASVLIIVFNRSIIGVFNSNPDVIAAGSGILWLIALTLPIQSIQFILSGALRGAGDTRYTAIVMIITVFVVRSVTVLLLVNVFNLGLWGAWIALMADQMIRTALIVWRFRSGKWALARTIDN